MPRDNLAQERKLRTGVWTTLCMAAVTALLFLVPVPTRGAPVWSGRAGATATLIVVGLMVLMTAVMAFALLVMATIEAVRRGVDPALWLLSLAVSATVLAALDGLVMTIAQHVSKVAIAPVAQPVLIVLTVVAVISTASFVGRTAYSLARKRGNRLPIVMAATALAMEAVLTAAAVAVASPNRGAGDVYGALLTSASIPSFFSSAATDSCSAGYGYLDTRAFKCYQGAGPGANNSAGNNHVVPNCPTGAPYYNAGTDRCYSSIPGHRSNPGAGGSTASPTNDCQISSAGNNRYYRVNSTSSTPCYSHWTISGSFGTPGCGFYNSSGGPFQFPANVWNIDWWENQPGGVTASLDDGTIVSFRCVVNLRNYPQMALNRLNWS